MQKVISLEARVVPHRLPQQALQSLGELQHGGFPSRDGDHAGSLNNGGDSPFEVGNRHTSGPFRQVSSLAVFHGYRDFWAAFPNGQSVVICVLCVRMSRHLEAIDQPRSNHQPQLVLGGRRVGDSFQFKTGALSGIVPEMLEGCKR